MTIEIQCETCGAQLVVGDEQAGMLGKCPACGTQAQIPGEAESTAASADDDLAEVAAPAEADEFEDGIPLDDDDDAAPTPIVFSGGDEAPSDSGSTIGAGDDGGMGSGSQVGKDSVEQEETIRPEDVPSHLAILNHYLICDHKDVVARWENDGRGWMVRIKDGFVRSATVNAQLPKIGNFVLIEVDVERKEDGLHLKQFNTFQLRRQYALTQLTKAEEAILGTVTSKATLNDRQKRHVRELVRSKFLPKMLDVLDELLA